MLIVRLDEVLEVALPVICLLAHNVRFSCAVNFCDSLRYQSANLKLCIIVRCSLEFAWINDAAWE